MKNNTHELSERKKQILKGGDCFYCEAGEPHSLLCLEGGSVMLDIFTPMREDFIK